ncbi:MAG: hypothetical protein J2P32_13485, partial [Actinobacteria bacterium]|nr:hypothetical protein [Actinomycetota bacterium]
RLAELREMLAIFEDKSVNTSPSVEFWQQAWNLLPALADKPFDTKSKLERLVLRKLFAVLPLPIDFGDLDTTARKGALRSLRPDWLAHALAGEEGPPQVLRAKRWARWMLREQLALGLLVAVTGTADWMGALARLRRIQHDSTDLAQLWLDDALTGHTELLVGLLTEMPGRDSPRAQREEFLGAWLTLATTLVWTTPLLDTLHRGRAYPDGVLAPLKRLIIVIRHRINPPETTRGTLERIKDQLRARAPPQRHEVLGQAAEQLERAVRDGVTFYYRDAGLDPRRPLRFEPDSEESNALVRYLPVAHPVYRTLFAPWLRAWQRGGDRDAANQAWDKAWRAWLGTHGRYIARDDAPADLDTTITHPETGEELDVVVGVSRDPIETMHLGYPHLNCQCLVHGSLRQYAQVMLLHPRVAVLYVWRRGENGKDRRLATLDVFVTDHGIFLVNNVYSMAGIDRSAFVPAFAAYLRTWADTTGRPLIERAGEEPTGLLPDNTDTTELKLSFPTPGAPANIMWSDRAGGTFKLPTVRKLRVRRYAPATTGPHADAGGEIVASGETGLPGGLVAFEPWSTGRTKRLLKMVRAAPAEAFTPLEWLYPALAERGPPGVRVVVFDGELPGVVAFGWAERGVVVISRSMMAKIAGHLASGRLDDAWWRGLLEHERDFHLPGGARYPE